ncbi:hypothetical protein F5B19DRAFT_477110 [Rostrohypoxylon terebratum]|nr:hypothetical protein F5B19DRAFT_477110 [Rostrohypoxylon terebratum]
MVVQCSRVTDLMYYQGFNWGISNVEQESGFVTECSKDVLDPTLKNQYTNTRQWLLKDKHDPNPAWAASIRVHGNLEALSNIRLQDWTPKMIKIAEAVNPSGQLIYSFDRDQPQNAFNAICDHMPLEGWWPWPKKT